MMKRRTVTDLLRARTAGPDGITAAAVAAILEDVRREGEHAVRRHAERLGDIAPGGPLFLERAELGGYLDELPRPDRELLERAADRIRQFATAQRAAMGEMTIPVPGGEAGHTVIPIERAGCYAPGGRYPLVSSLLMTAITARVAGVRTVWLASPRPGSIMLAAAALAGVDGVIGAGGAQAIGALAYGCGPIGAVDVIAGPGNRFVTAAKQLVSGFVGIDMVAGPTEVVVWADRFADAELVASDLLAQAEHDSDAMPVLVTDDAELADDVDRAIETQVAALDTAVTARAALLNGGTVLVSTMEEALACCDALAPEHLSLHLRDAGTWAERVRHCGALFIGAGAGVALGDFGAGPNHVLPTAGAARRLGGLSVLDFVRLRSWLRIDDVSAATALYGDTVALARMEGLDAHARSAARRMAG